MVCTCWFFISCNWFYFPSWAETHQHWKSVSAGCCLKENKTFFFTEKKRVKGDVSLRSKTINIPQRNMFFFSNVPIWQRQRMWAAAGCWMSCWLCNFNSEIGTVTQTRYYPNLNLIYLFFFWPHVTTFFFASNCSAYSLSFTNVSASFIIDRSWKSSTVALLLLQLGDSEELSRLNL